MELTRRLRNDLFQTLAQKGVDPADCELSASEDLAQIVHHPTDSAFSFSNESSRYRIWWNVVDGPDNGVLGTRCPTWADVLDRLGFWSEQVKYVTETSDLWADLREVPKVLTAAQTTDAINAPFTSDEQAEIARRLDEVRQLVRKQFELTSEQLAAIDQRLDDAEEASKRLGRKDWMLMFYGAVMSTAITDAMPPGVIQTVLVTVLHAIAHLFGFGGPPPMISP